MSENIESTEITVRIITNKKVYEKKCVCFADAENYYDDITNKIGIENTIADLG